MARIPVFSDLFSKHDEILQKNYCFNNKILLNTRLSKENSFLSSKISDRKDEGLGGSVRAQYSTNWLDINAKLSSEKYYNAKVKVTPEKYLRDFKGFCEIGLSPSLGIQYFYELTKGKISYYINSSIVKLELTAGYPVHGIGLEINYQIFNKEFRSISPAIWWGKKHSKLLLKYTSDSLSLGTLNISYYQKINKSTHFVSSIETDLKSSSTNIQVGGDYKFDEYTLVKGKISSIGTIGLAFSRVINKNLKATLATEINTETLVSHADSQCKLGLRIDFSS
jgi:Eukaryotic porin